MAMGLHSKLVERTIPRGAAGENNAVQCRLANLTEYWTSYCNRLGNIIAGNDLGAIPSTTLPHHTRPLHPHLLISSSPHPSPSSVVRSTKVRKGPFYNLHISFRIAGPYKLSYIPVRIQLRYESSSLSFSNSHACMLSYIFLLRTGYPRDCVVTRAMTVKLGWL